MKERFRNLGASFVAFLLIMLGFTRRAKKKALGGDFILSIYFHAPSKRHFEFCIKWLIKNNFSFLSQEDVYRIHQKHAAFPKGSVVITVDDGWMSNEENVAAIANKYKIPVTIFVSTDAIENGGFWWPYMERAGKIKMINKSVESLKTLANKEREKMFQEVKGNIQLERAAMTVAQVKKIAKLNFVTIGGHTVSHPILPMCENDESYRELKKSKELIEDWTGEEVLYFAYPNGNYTEREIAYLKELGYTLAYNAKPIPLTPGALEKNYELPRFDVMEDVSNAEAICRMVGVWQRFFDKNGNVN